MGLYFGTGGAKDEMLGVDWERGHTPNSNTQCHSGREVNPGPYCAALDGAARGGIGSYLVVRALCLSR
jgi:hypothetical protein